MTQNHDEYQVYEQAMEELKNKLNAINIDKYPDINADYPGVIDDVKKLCEEIEDAWENALHDKLKNQYCKEFSERTVGSLMSGLQGYFIQEDKQTFQEQMAAIRKRLADFRNYDAEMTNNPASGRSQKPVSHAKQPRQKESQPPPPPPAEKAAPAAVSPSTLQEIYFRPDKFFSKFFKFLRQDVVQPDETLNQRIRMIIMFQLSEPDAPRVYLLNEYRFHRKTELLNDTVYYEHIYHPGELEFASDTRITDEMRKKIMQVFDSRTGGNTNDYGLYIRLYPDFLRIELKRRGDAVSLNAAIHPDMADAVHEIELSPKIHTEHELKFAKKTIYFDTDSGHQNSETQTSRPKAADVKMTISLSLSIPPESKEK